MIMSTNATRRLLRLTILLGGPLLIVFGQLWCAHRQAQRAFEGAQAAFLRSIQNGLDRGARIEHPRPGVFAIELGATPHPGLPAAERARADSSLARTVARQAWGDAAALPTDSVVVRLRHERRLGPMTLGADVTTYGFGERP